MKVLLCTTIRGGGVASYFAALQGKFKEQVDYLIVGSRSGRENLYTKLWRVVGDCHRLYQMLRRERYDIVHLNPSLDFKAVARDAILLWISRLFRVRRLIFFHGWKESFEQKLRGIAKRLFAWTFFEADAIIVLDSEVKAKLETMGYRGKIYIFTGAVDDQLFAAIDEKAIERKYDPASRPIVLLFLSRVERAKGVYELLETYRLLRQRKQNIRLVIAGDGSELQALRAKATALNLAGIEFTGFVSGTRKIDVLREADLFMMPSYTEGMPLALLEAMAFGLPVFTRPVGGIRDFFENERMGFWTESTDPREYQETIGVLLENAPLRRKMALYNHRYAKEHFRTSEVIAKLEGVYGDILHENSKKAEAGSAQLSEMNGTQVMR